MGCIVLSALFLICVFRICCQRRLTRWWSGPLGGRSSGWTGTSSGASSRPHPGTTLSSSCSLPCSLKDSVLSAGPYTHRHTQDQCTVCRPQSSMLLPCHSSVLSFYFLRFSFYKFTLCTEGLLQWKNLWALKSQAPTLMFRHKHKWPRTHLIFHVPAFHMHI